MIIKKKKKPSSSSTQWKPYISTSLAFPIHTWKHKTNVPCQLITVSDLSFACYTNFIQFLIFPISSIFFFSFFRKLQKWRSSHWLSISILDENRASSAEKTLLSMVHDLKENNFPATFLSPLQEGTKLHSSHQSRWSAYPCPFLHLFFPHQKSPLMVVPKFASASSDFK